MRSISLSSSFVGLNRKNKKSYFFQELVKAPVFLDRPELLAQNSLAFFPHVTFVHVGSICRLAQAQHDHQPQSHPQDPQYVRASEYPAHKRPGLDSPSHQTRKYLSPDYMPCYIR